MIIEKKKLYHSLQYVKMRFTEYYYLAFTVTDCFQHFTKICPGERRKRI